jgi:hypothetical protein
MSKAIDVGLGPGVTTGVVAVSVGAAVGVGDGSLPPPQAAARKVARASIASKAERMDILQSGF